MPRRANIVGLALLLALAVGAAPRLLAAGPAPEPPRLAGVLPWTERIERAWPWSGAWLFPIGDSLDFTIPLNEVPPYQVNRGVIAPSAEGPGHQGADLANGRAGDRVRAVAHGVVACVHSATTGGYGVHLVIAHRLDDGRLVYSVYAHLRSGSVRVREGHVVHAGDAIARVGQTGRATTPHLHFEVRVPEDSTLRWEKCPVVDPVQFVNGRLPADRPDTTWSDACLRWAEFAALMSSGGAADAPVGLAQLRRMVGRASARDPEGLDQALGESAGLLTSPAAEPRDATWDQVSRAIRWLEGGPRRLAPSPRRGHAQRLVYEQRLGTEHPARDTAAIRRRPGRPTIGDCCLLLADLAPDSPR